ncbi:hypothetical protein DPMN_132693 [Dreissena polymorpha]|uniref:Uncharacterized protein n=1 Tax=Dreissena polymorpha TaxID=45954 RepID=A0A9D4JDB9_DREPO|nr:hypothetical protein DPMN_132693 [Dreissena polymorpha]
MKSTRFTISLNWGFPRAGNGPCIVEIDSIVIREVQFQLDVNRCRNEENDRIVIRIVEIIGKGNFGWVWPIWAGSPRIDRIVIREVQYQLEVNWCRNEEVKVKGNVGWVWPMWVGSLRIDRIYKFELNRCRNEEIIVKGNFGWVWSMWAGRPRIDRIVLRGFQGSSAYSVGGDSGQDGQTDGQTAEITTISPRFLKSVGIMK